MTKEQLKEEYALVLKARQWVWQNIDNRRPSPKCKLTYLLQEDMSKDLATRIMRIVERERSKWLFWYDQTIDPDKVIAFWKKKSQRTKSANEREAKRIKNRLRRGKSARAQSHEPTQGKILGGSALEGLRGSRGGGPAGGGSARDDEAGFD